MESGEWIALALGFAGSILVELLFLERSLRRGRRYVAVRYSDWVFWLVRVLIACGSAVLAWAYYAPGVPKVLYFQIGASTPALIRQFAARRDDRGD